MQSPVKSCTRGPVPTFLVRESARHSCCGLALVINCRVALVLDTRVAFMESARDLGVVIDRELSLREHVTAVCRSGFNQLRHLRPVVCSLSVHATKTLVQAFISCRLDYCNSLLYGINPTGYFAACSQCRTLPRAWSQAPVVGTTSHQCYGSGQLHWLPVRQRVIFKIAGLVHQSLAGAAPAYLADDCLLLSDAGRSLRSNSNDM